VLNLVGEFDFWRSRCGKQALNEFAERFPKDELGGKFADVNGVPVAQPETICSAR